ncbi:MAG: hypothetical protein GQ550_10105 [Gammaproteobacteria bacterium]|nr:hypothetical protein [Gammaproteobacteria bacterium]
MELKNEISQMVTLTDGRVIDLSMDRSKHHALRQPGVGPASTHRELYSLVDIIYRHLDESGKPKRGMTEYDYEFSGYTLDTVRFASDWSEKDKSILSRWLQQKNQRRRIETARRRLIDNQQQLSVKLYSSPNHLYSLLQHRLMNMPQQRATAKQWLATINNLKKSGVREEEIEWSCLRQYLLQQPTDALITKAQLLKNRNDKNSRIELSTELIWGDNGGLNFLEVAQRMPHQVVYRAALNLDHDCLCIVRYVDNYFNYRVGVIKTLSNDHHMALNKYWFALDPYGRAINSKNSADGLDDSKMPLLFDNSVEAKSAADKHARDHFGIRSGVSTHTQFDYLTLFGGHDYREWFVSLPDHQRIFFGKHFYDHNILAHIRTTTRTDNTGRKILFIEEVQSDWHQSGKRNGYNNSCLGQVANAPYKKEWPVLAMKLMLIHASQNGFAGVAWAKGAVQEMRYMCDLQAIKQYYDKEIPKALNRLVKKFNCRVETTHINTRKPWLNIEKKQDKWRVADGHGKFRTKAKYINRDDAMAVVARHCPSIELKVFALMINEDLRRQISEKGLPQYGHTIY